MDKEVKDKIDTVVKEAVKEVKEVDIEKMVNDKVEAELAKRNAPPAKVVFGQAPEDEIVKSKLGGFKSAGHFYSALIKAGTPNGFEDETLKTWKEAVKKTAGTMEESDLAQGG
jgi:hypothetical protein